MHTKNKIEMYIIKYYIPNHFPDCENKSQVPSPLCARAGCT